MARDLFQLVTPEVAWERLRSALADSGRARPTERVPSRSALGRVTGAEIRAPHSLPEFRRSTVDGFAVRAVDTHGASASLPALLTLKGEVAMGAAACLELGPGQAAVLHTGGMLPAGADAALMLEHAECLGDGTLEAYRPLAAGENVIQIGEDVRQGEAVLARGHWLRPQDLGALLGLGITEVEVVCRPRVAILSQGDELVPPERATTLPGQVRDINSYALAALVQEAGGEPLLSWGIIEDRLQALEEAARQAHSQADLLVFSAGSSVSAQDITPVVVAKLGQPGILAHGLSIKPGKPTIVAACQGKPVFGLPGNPVSAMVVFRLLVARAIALLLGAAPRTGTVVRARLARNIASATGRQDFVPVRLEERQGERWAVPVFGKSNLICTLVRAVGLVQVDLDKNGLAEGDAVEVELF